MPALPLLPLADLGAIIQAIVFLVILGSGVVKMFRESKEAQQRAGRPRPQPQPRRAADPLDEPQVAQARGGGQAAPPEPQDAIRSEVEEFLRRVQGKPDAPPQQAKQQPKRQPRIEVLDDDGFGVDPRPRETRRAPRKKVHQAESTYAEAESPITAPQKNKGIQRREGINRGESVAEHVADHMRRGAFEERASHMGEELSQTDERLEARLHEKFDHRMGTLSARRQAREADDAHQKEHVNSVADNLFDLLSTPQGVQQAVLLNEILTRPADRWE